MGNPCQTYCEHSRICVIYPSFPRMCTIRKILIMSEPGPIDRANILATSPACHIIGPCLTLIVDAEGKGKVTHKGISQNKQEVHFCSTHIEVQNINIYLYQCYMILLVGGRREGTLLHFVTF